MSKDTVAWKVLSILLLLSIIGFVPLLVFSPNADIIGEVSSVVSEFTTRFECPKGLVATGIACGRTGCGGETMRLKCTQVESVLSSGRWIDSGTTGKCPSGTVMTGFDCVGKCSQENMKSQCTPIDATLGDIQWSDWSTAPDCPSGSLMKSFDCGNSCTERDMKVGCQNIICDNDGNCDSTENSERCPQDCGKDLSDYPDFLISSTGIHAQIVVDDKAPAQHVIGATDIMTELVNDCITKLGDDDPQCKIPDMITLDTEVSDISSQNIISIGCDNSVTRLIMDEKPCGERLEKGHGRIELFFKYGRYYIVVSGNSSQDVRYASEYLALHQHLEGTVMERAISGSVS